MNKFWTAAADDAPIRSQAFAVRGRLFDLTRTIDRRQFIGFLLTTLSVALGQTGEAGSIACNHFYFMHLSSGIIYLPDNSRLDVGQPGSLMKLVAAAAIIEQNLPSASRVIDCKGSIIVNGKHYTCRHVHGRVGIVEAIAQSCNVFFAQAAKQMTKDCFVHYFEKFGLAQFLPGHLVRSSLRSIDFVFGTAEHFELTAIEILQMVALIATRGKLLPLSLNSQPGHKIPSRDPRFSDHTWNVLQQGMQMCCQTGTAKNLDPQNKFHIAAKTGTTIHGYTFQSWLAGYFPYEHPRYAFCLRAKVGTSYDQAVPMARQALLEHTWP